MRKEDLFEKETLNKLLKKLKKGNKLKIYFGEDNINNEVIEIREIVDKEHIVYRTKNQIKNSYAYRMKDLIWFYTLENDDCLFTVEG